MYVRMCDVHKTERAVHGPFSARLWSVQYPFESRLTSVLLKRSGVKRTVHGFFFCRILYVRIFSLSEAIQQPVLFSPTKNLAYLAYAVTILYSCSVDSRKMCVGVKYYMLLHITICTICYTTLMVVQLLYHFILRAYSAYISLKNGSVTRGYTYCRKFN